MAQQRTHRLKIIRRHRKNRGVCVTAWRLRISDMRNMTSNAHTLTQYMLNEACVGPTRQNQAGVRANAAALDC